MRDDTSHDTEDTAAVTGTPETTGRTAGAGNGSALSKLPSVEVEASPRKLWKRDVSGLGGSVEFQLSLSGSVSARFADESPPHGGSDHPRPETGDRSGDEQPAQATESRAAPEAGGGTVSAELSVTYTPPTKLTLSATLPISRSIESTLGACEVEGSPTFELDMTVKPDAAGKSAPSPRNAEEFLRTYGSLLESVGAQAVVLRSDRGRSSRVALVAAVLLALIGWALAGWAFSGSRQAASAASPPSSLPVTSTQVSLAGGAGSLPGIGTVVSCTDQPDQAPPASSTVPGATLSAPTSRGVQDCVITVSSTGANDLDITGVVPNADASVVGDTCTTLLPRGQTCLISVDRALSVAANPDTVTIHQNLPGPPSVVDIPAATTTTTTASTTTTTSTTVQIP